jgi:hypothetical protein
MFGWDGFKFRNQVIIEIIFNRLAIGKRASTNGGRRFICQGGCLPICGDGRGLGYPKAISWNGMVSL